MEGIRIKRMKEIEFDPVPRSGRDSLGDGSQSSQSGKAKSAKKSAKSKSKKGSKGLKKHQAELLLERAEILKQVSDSNSNNDRGESIKSQSTF